MSIDSVADEAKASPDLKRARRQRAARVTGLDRLPPHSEEMERGVLGCILLQPQQVLPVVIEKLKGGAETFYDLRHQTIYTQILKLYEERAGIDIITLQQSLKDAQLLEQIGGIPYLNVIQDSVPSAANVSYYLDIVTEKFLLRKTIQVCTDAIGSIFDHEGEVDQLLDEVERDIFKVTGLRLKEQDKTIKEATHDAINTIEKAHSGGGLMGIETGFPDLDKMLTGLHGAELIILAARPSMGKTSLAMNIVEHVAIKNQIPVGVFSLEMSTEALVLRMLCSHARVDLQALRSGFLSEADVPKLTVAAAQVSKAPIFIDDTPGQSILRARAKARRWVQQHGIKLLVGDYLQLFHSTSKRAQDNRQQEISEITAGFKALAKELDIPVVILCQLNRELEKTAGKNGKTRKPRLSDLRESGAIEQDADVVGLLYKASEGDEDEEQADLNTTLPVNLLIAKQRNGPTGDVNLTFLKRYTRFESAAKVSTEDYVPE